MEALVALALLACPLGMGLMMWMMGRGMMGGNKGSEASSESLADLKAEQARLDARIADTERRQQADPVARRSIR